MLSGCMIIEVWHPIDRTKFGALASRAEMGDTAAQLQVARAYGGFSGGCAWGPWRPQHDDKACLKWYTRAAENGNAEAQNELANIYDPNVKSFCVAEKNADTSLKWHLAAANQNYVPAFNALCQTYSQEKHDAQSAAMWCAKADTEKQNSSDKKN